MTDPNVGIDDDFELARQRLEEIGARARENTERARTLADDARHTTADARSPRGEVTVRAGVGGRIDAVTFGASAEHVSLDHLGRLTRQTIADAQHAAMKRLADSGATTFGADSDVARSLRRDADTGYPPATPTFG